MKTRRTVSGRESTLRMKFRSTKPSSRKANLSLCRAASEHCPVADEKVHIIADRAKIDVEYRQHHNERLSPARAHLKPAPAAIYDQLWNTFYTLDVFTNNRFEGNPLAVFTDATDSRTTKCSSSRANESSETVFVQKPTKRSPARLAHLHDKENSSSLGILIGTWFLLAELASFRTGWRRPRPPRDRRGASCRWKSASGWPPAARDMTQKEAISSPRKSQEKACLRTWNFAQRFRPETAT